MNAALYYISLLAVPLAAWNVETRIPIVFAGHRDSYFGFSVALNENSKGSFALVSATKANSTFGARRSLHQPGVVYKCGITNARCKEIVFETTAYGASTVDPPVSYISKEDDMWLGVSLDVQTKEDGNILACGHLWRNQQYRGHYYVNGACYLIDREFRNDSRKMLVPLTHKDKQSAGKDYYYAYATAGMSAIFIEGDYDLDVVVGAPGFCNWRGAVVGYSTNQYDSLFPVLPEPPLIEDSKEHAYVGYSITSGRFYDEGFQLVAGAPRDHGHKGKVYILDSNLRKMMVKEEIHGDQMGEYFGACVVGIDINGDSIMDLFVGAPLYSLRGVGEEGKVYTYISSGKKLWKHRELMGPRKARSRFGTTIAHIGDINQDGFNDVAIGAPYEDDHGAIYIYHGGMEGLDQRFKQRIAALDVRPSLSGFGMSISRGKDVDRNGYPDFLVGSYASDHAVLFRTRPVVKVFGSIDFDPPKLDPDSSTCIWNNNLVPCFKITIRLWYEGAHVPQELDISTTLTSARQGKQIQIRRYLLDGYHLTSHIRRNVTLMRRGEQEKDKHSYDQLAYVVSDANDFVTPIQIGLNFKLKYDVTKEKSFCKHCPMLHPDLPSTILKTIGFNTGCGNDSICNSDLVLAVGVSGLSNGVLVLGRDNVITLSVEVKNVQEPAYNTYVHIHIPSGVQIINKDHCEDSENFRGSIEIVCRAGNPLKRDQMARFVIKLNPSMVSTESGSLRIRVNATTASTEINLSDNYEVIVLPLNVTADITIFGKPVTERKLIFETRGVETDDESIEIVHHYTVMKYLPAPINRVAVAFLIPTTSALEEDMHFFKVTTVKVNEGGSLASVNARCEFINREGLVNKTLIPGGGGGALSTTVSPVGPPDILTPKPMRKKRSIDDGVALSVSSTSSGKGSRPRSNALDCNTLICTVIRCEAGPFVDTTKSATFRIHGSVNTTSLKTVMAQYNFSDQWDEIKIVTEGKVTILDSNGKYIQPANHRPDEAKVSTVLQRVSMKPTSKVESWVIILSVIAGVVLLIIICLVLIKLGFFRRKEKEQMENMMMKAELKEGQELMGAERGS